MNKKIKGITIAVLLLGLTVPVWAQEVIVLGSQEETLALLEKDKWWSEKKRGQQLKVPYTMVVAISKRWRENAPKMQVSLKKEIFFSSLLPLVLHANSMVLDRRDQLKKLDARLARGGSLTSEEISKLMEMAVLLRIKSSEDAARRSDSAEFRKVLKEALYKLDVIPPGLVLGQAAYESGYATSRFAVEGNALFGQWTYGGKGMVPGQQRKELGDHRIASFEWPFDSVRGYYINLSSHPAYADFRRLRAERKASGKPLSSLALADGLQKYSERGQEYVDTLKGIIRVNDLDIADNAVLRDESMRFLLGAVDRAAAAKLRRDIEDMRKSGEISKIIDRMRLE